MELQKAQIKKIEEFVERFRYKATKASQVQSRIKMLDKFKEIKLEGGSKSITMRFPEGKKSVREVVKVSNLGHSYGDLTVFSGLNFSLFRGDKVAFVGVNGSGKSTLSRLLSLTEQPRQGIVQYGDHVNMAFSHRKVRKTSIMRTRYGKKSTPYPHPQMIRPGVIYWEHFFSQETTFLNRSVSCRVVKNHGWRF